MVSIEYNGKKYRSYRQLAIENGISQSTLKQRLYRGMTVKEAIEKPIYSGILKNGSEIIYNGKKYDSRRQLSEELGISYKLFVSRLERGMSIEEAVNRDLKRVSQNKEMLYRGKKYVSLYALSKETGVPCARIRNRLSRGMSIEEAVETEVVKGRPRDNNIVYHGKKYMSYKQLAEEVGIPYNAFLKGMRKWLCTKKGMTVEEAVELLVKGENFVIEYNGKKYTSYKQLSEEIGVPYKVLYPRLSRGMSIEEAIEKPLNKKTGIVYDGKEYSSVRALTEEKGLRYNTIMQRIHRGMSIEEAVTYESNNKVIYEGKEYASLAELSKKLGIPADVLRGRMKKGMGLEEAVELPKAGPIKCQYHGVKYDSLRDLANAVGMTYATLYSRYCIRGMSLEEAVESNLRGNSIDITYKGVQYKSLKELAEKIGINYDGFRERLKQGMSVEEAVERARNIHTGK